MFSMPRNRTILPSSLIGCTYGAAEAGILWAAVHLVGKKATGVLSQSVRRSGGGKKTRGYYGDPLLG